MPLLFCFPLIVWMGMMNVIQEDLGELTSAHNPVSPT